VDAAQVVHAEPRAGTARAADAGATADGEVLAGRAWLRRYRRAWLRLDVVAGLTVGGLLVPQSMAYAELAGVPPVAGLPPCGRSSRMPPSAAPGTWASAPSRAPP
jgi:hypothetical protein